MCVHEELCSLKLSVLSGSAVSALLAGLSLVSWGEANLDPGRCHSWLTGEAMCEHASLPQSCFSPVSCSDPALLWLSCVLVRCFALAACIMGGRQDGVPMSECATHICPTFLPQGNTNSVQIVDIAVSDATPVKKHLWFPFTCNFRVSNYISAVVLVHWQQLDAF